MNFGPITAYGIPMARTRTTRPTITVRSETRPRPDAVMAVISSARHHIRRARHRPFAVAEAVVGARRGGRRPAPAGVPCDPSGGLVDQRRGFRRAAGEGPRPYGVVDRPPAARPVRSYGSRRPAAVCRLGSQ